MLNRNVPSDISFVLGQLLLESYVVLRSVHVALVIVRHRLGCLRLKAAAEFREGSLTHKIDSTFILLAHACIQTRPISSEYN